MWTTALQIGELVDTAQRVRLMPQTLARLISCRCTTKQRHDCLSLPLQSAATASSPSCL
jgi:hypothetical protein